ncbi:MAG: VanZ family protein [Pseudomonadota bacterium]
MTAVRITMAARIMLAFLLVYVTVQSLVPAPQMPDEGLALTRWLAALVLGGAQHTDKITHFLVYGLLGFFAGASIPLQPHRADQPTFAYGLYALTALCVYGVTMEGAQHLGSIRSGDWGDALANSLGVLAGLVGFVVVALPVRRVLAAGDRPGHRPA